MSRAERKGAGDIRVRETSSTTVILRPGPHRKMVTQEESATVSEGEGAEVARGAGQSQRAGHVGERWREGENIFVSIFQFIDKTEIKR